MYSGINYGGWALLLMAFGFGYIILVRSLGEDDHVIRKTGYLVALIIMVVTIALAALNFVDTMKAIRNSIKRGRRTNLPLTSRIDESINEARQLPRSSLAKTALGIMGQESKKDGDKQ